KIFGLRRPLDELPLFKVVQHMTNIAGILRMNDEKIENVMKQVICREQPKGDRGNFQELTTELNAKALETLKEAVPQARRIGVLWNPTTPSQVPGLVSVKAAGEKLGVALHVLSAATLEDFDAALASAAREGVDALFVVPAPVTTLQRAR